jgi:hypothetical protein
MSGCREVTRYEVSRRGSEVGAATYREVTRYEVSGGD